MRRVAWTADAAGDRSRLVAYLAEDNPYAARRLAMELDQAAASLTDFPHRGRPGQVAGTRELVTVPPYIMVYEVDASIDAVVILRVWHAAQDR